MIENRAGNDTDRLVEENIGLIYMVLKRFKNRGRDMEELFQVGAEGLTKAAARFEPDRGYAFSTYAVPMIIGEVKRYLRDNSTLRVSRSLRDTAYKALSAKEALTTRNQKEPSITEIADEIGISSEDICEALDALQAPVSLYDPVFNDGGDTLYVIDQIRDKKDYADTFISNFAIKKAIEKISERERQIILLRFYDGKTQMEVANMIGISQAQVSRLEKDALKSMRKYLE